MTTRTPRGITCIHNALGVFAVVGFVFIRFVVIIVVARHWSIPELGHADCAVGIAAERTDHIPFFVRAFRWLETFRGSEFYLFLR